MDKAKINYLEIPAVNFDETKRFYTQVFGWKLIDYGPDYMAFENAGINGGFYKSKLKSTSQNGSVLIVFYAKSLIGLHNKISQNGGKIIKDTYSFPGGYRFHFTDPNGNEFAVWSEENN